MSQQYTAYVIVLILASSISATIALAIWRRRSTPGSLSFVLLMLAVAEWAFTVVLEVATPDIPAHILWSKIQYLGIASSPTLFLLFALQYTRQDKWLTRHPLLLAALWIVPILTILIAWTNSSTQYPGNGHHWLWTSFTPNPDDSHILIYGHGLWFWVALTYGYLQVLVGALVLTWAVVRFPNLYRQQTAALVISAAMPIVGNVVYLFFNPIPGLDWTPVTFALTGLILAWSIDRFQLLDLVPVARDLLIENLGDGVLVLDALNRIVDINPSAQQLIQLTTPVIGQSAEATLSAWPNLLERVRDAREAVVEILVDQESPRYLDSRISPLHDRRGHVTGWLIVLRDITQRKLAEQAEQEQRALAESLLEQARQRNQRLALINEISIAINQPVELSVVLQTAVDGLTRVMGVSQVGLALFDETRQHLTVSADHPAPGNSSAVGIELPIEGNLSLQRILNTQSPLVIADAQNDPIMSNVREIMAQQHIQSILIVPLIVRDRVIGTIGCDAIEAPRHFTSEEIALAQTVANLVALRIEQARLFESEYITRKQAQRHAADLSSLYAITRATSRSLALEDVLGQALLSAMISLGFEAGMIALAESDVSLPGLRLAASRGLPLALVKQIETHGLDDTLIAYIHSQREITLIDDLKQEVSAALHNMVEMMGTAEWHSYIGIPLMHQEQSLGVMCLLGRQPRSASSHDLTMLTGLSHQVATAVANAQLFQVTLNERSRLKALIESSRDGIVLTSIEGRIAVANAPALQMLRLSGHPDDWLGMTVREALSGLRDDAPAAFQAVEAEIERIRTGDEPSAQGEFEVPPRAIRWQSLPVRVGIKPVGRLLVLTDMTEERAIERLRQDMTHTMVHDLRNPLSGISTSLGFLTGGVMGQLTPEQLDILRIAQHSTLRMLELVNAILDVSRLESGRMPLELEAFSLTELLSETLDWQTTLANEKGIRLECNASATLPPAWADVKLIQRVLQNLIGNAIKFTPSGGTVCVTARAHERADRPLLLVSVSDTGPGIPSEIQSRLFQRFVAGTQEERGSGLGLAFCKLALEAHGERIWMASTPGNGATFTFSLPVATPLPAPDVSDL